MDSLVAAPDFLFGCHHNNLSRTFTFEGQTYRVCCDCGAKFKYSLASMSVERRPSWGPHVKPARRRLRSEIRMEESQSVVESKNKVQNTRMEPRRSAL